MLGAALATGIMHAFPGGLAPTAASTAARPPGTWRPWLLTQADELRPGPPAPPTPEERTELLTLQGQRTALTLASLAPWDDPTVVLPWSRLALDLIQVHQTNPVRAGRALALLHVALADTLIATEDARAAYARPGPAADPALVPVGAGRSPAMSFPSAVAAVATAAATVVTSLVPTGAAATFATLADAAAHSQLLAARAFRSDVVAGQAIGTAVGERAVARGKADGSAAAWDGTGRRTDPGSWQPTPPAYVQQPVEPLAGHWQPWLLARGDQDRPPPPPPFGSPAWDAEVVGVQDAVARRTPEQAAAVRRWAGTPGTVTPAGLWIEIAHDLIARDRLDAPPAARVLALTSVAMADGFICCWDAKYTYWTERPITADPTLDTLIPTPPFPSYTSGHATISTAAATVLGHLFPDDASALLDQAEEAKNSRLWAGIHFPLDCEMGAVGGGLIGRLAMARAHEDGAE
jgi:membrane-associated phospholipid phosphatase